MTSDTSSPRRRDAARNRERLLEAAAVAFREEGLGASVNHIATDAGLNVATLQVAIKGKTTTGQRSRWSTWAWP